MRVTNDEAVIHSLLDKFTPLAPTLIVLKATVGYQVLTVTADGAGISSNQRSTTFPTQPMPLGRAGRTMSKCLVCS